MTSKRLPSIPPHLAAYPWYAPHQAWLEAQGRKSRHAVPRDVVANRASLQSIDLSRENLSGACLSLSNFALADLSGANLSGADLSGSFFFYVNFSEANLSGSNLSGTNFLNANLFRANLTEAYISGANLSGANLSGATWAHARGFNHLANGAYLAPLLSGSWVYVPGPSR